MIKRLFDDFTKLRVMVVGDVMVDAYLWGKVERISPEAPIPVVALKSRENRMGGAANVALNLRSLGATPVLCTVIGDDEKGRQFAELCQTAGIDTSGIIVSHQRRTTTKFRIFGNTYQMLRVDEEDDFQLSSTDQNGLLKSIKKIFSQTTIDCVIFQDYDKGVITPGIISQVVELANKKGIPVTVDPKKRNFREYRNVTLFKPNLKELREGLNMGHDLASTQEVIEAVRTLRSLLSCQSVMTTMSEKGVLISYDKGNEDVNTLIPAHLRTIADVSGAGDTVISVASLLLALGRPYEEVAWFANLAGGLVCEEVGVVPVNPEKLLNEALQLL